MKPSDVLIQAKQLISSPTKWCQGSFDEGEKHCAVGAIMTIAETLQDKSPSYRARTYLMELVGIATEWNDSPYRTHQEVMETFDKAIERAKKNSE
jgi:hypothetical protein